MLLFFFFLSTTIVVEVTMNEVTCVKMTGKHGQDSGEHFEG